MDIKLNAGGSSDKSKPRVGQERNWARQILRLALAWTALGVALAAPGMLSGSDWPELIGKVVDAWTWGLLTPFILATDRGLHYSDRQLAMRIATLLLLSPTFSLVHVYITAVLLLPVPGILWNPLQRPDYFRYWFLDSWEIYCLITGALLMFRYYRRYLASEMQLERLERDFLQARLNALRTQLDPHFLFNALNSISSEVGEHPRRAREMIEHLGDLLRLSLDTKDRQEVPLTEEIAFLDHYLAIQKIRFGDRLKIEIHIAPEVKYALVPSLLLQPLAENAIRHGLSERSSGGTVTISAERVDKRIEIRVLDDGVGLPPGWQFETSARMGLTVTRERIAGLYPDGEGRLVVQRRTDGGTEVKISLPLRVTGEDTYESTSV